MADQEVVELVKALISKPSVTPKNEGCLELIADKLEACGFTAEYINRNETSNLWITKGSEGPMFVFAGHIDVVPPGQGWNTDPFIPEIKDGRLYGRGSQDMKTSDAAFTIAAKRFVTDYPDFKGSIAMLITSDEEGDAFDGTQMVIEVLRERGVKPDYCIVGEPTSTAELGDAIKVGRRGTQNGRIIVHGIQGHVAYPDKVKNPIHMAGELIDKLVKTKWDDGYPGFPATSFQVSNIHAGTGAENIVPGTCEFVFNLRHNPASSPQSIKDRIQGYCDELGLNVTTIWKCGALPFSTKGETVTSAITAAINKVCGITPEFSTSGGTSDGRFIATWCPEIIEFGPINDTIHKANESVPVDQIGKLCDVYYETLVNIFIKKA